jgi:hypothetical protein
MTGLNELACVAALTLLIQFVASILGPRVLQVFSLLLILAAAGVAVYYGNIALETQFAGEGADARDTATNFGLLAVIATIGHFFMRCLFGWMARVSHA